MYKNILILGGGTAGWMAANILAKRWAHHGVKVSLIESSDIGIIGVGEGSTPQLKSFFDYMEISEQEWMPACNATYKNGIGFRQWSTKPGFDQYFHPFPAQPDDYSSPVFVYNSFYRRKGVDLYAHPNRFFLATYLTEHKQGPKPAHNFPFRVGYGYHFDAGLVGQFLRGKAKALGVTHIDKRVIDVRLNAEGGIKELVTDDQQTLAADLFVDCSGFAALLIQQALKVPFVSFAQNLFNDSAVVMPTPQQDDFSPQTISTAMKCGWRWSIPLTNRVGNGYVYSSAFCSADEAEAELRAALGMLQSDVPTRRLKMKVGRVERHWEKNCLAVGLSQGFIEPLEATALHLVQETIVGFAEACEKGGFTDQQRTEFNQSINRRFESVRDYIVCHYRINSRTDTEYWRANAGNDHLSDSLRAILKVWANGEDLTKEVERQNIGQYYTPASWHCILAGYGVFPAQEQLRPDTEPASRKNLEIVDDFIQRCALNFASNKDQLALLR